LIQKVYLMSKRMVRRSLAVGVAAGGCVCVLAAQASMNPAFDVASVKPTRLSGQTLVLFNAGGQFRAINSTLRFLIRQAYQFQDGTQVVGGPGWLDSDAFDVEAKAEDNPAPSQLRLMLRTLLAERFKLTSHTDMRDVPIYALTMARSDGKAGQQFRSASETACVTLSSSIAPPGSFDRNRPPCGVLYSPIGHWTGRRVTVDTLANALSRVVGRPVVDRTGLAGTFDLDLRWTDVSVLLSSSTDPGDPLPQADGPSLFVALQEQLGLKLESTRGPVHVLVVDGAEHPTED
jgi:uncharacterized protein (TIGR03435 family)